MSMDTERKGNTMKNRDEKQAADFLGCSPPLMRRMRREGRGPRYTRIGRLVRYPEAWLLEYIEAHATPPRRPAEVQGERFMSRDEKCDLEDAQVNGRATMAKKGGAEVER